MNFLNFCALKLRAPFGIFTVCLASWALEPTVASAGIYNWGDLNDPGAVVMFLDVEEDNGYSTSLFAPEPGSGSPTAVGNSLLLDPQTFLSQSSGSSEVIDSEFSTTLMVGFDNAIETIVVDEFGDYTLGGLPGSLATAQVGATFYWQVLEIGGLSVNLPLQIQSLLVTTGNGPNGGIYDRPGDDGITTPWEGSAVIDVASFLAANFISGDATKVSLIFNNTLLTAADEFSSAFIKKKGVKIDVVVEDPFHVVPEPASVVLFGFGLVLFGRPRNRIR